MRKLLPVLLAVLLCFQVSPAQHRFGTWRNTSISYQLTLYPTTFENGTKNVSGFDNTWFSPAHIETGVYTIGHDTLYLRLRSVDGMTAINDGYAIAIPNGSNITVRNPSSSGNLYQYVSVEETLFVVGDTVYAVANCVGCPPQVTLFATGTSLLRNHPTWFGIDTMGVYREAQFGWTQVGTTNWFEVNPNNFIALTVTADGNYLTASLTQTEFKYTRIDSLNFARWYSSTITPITWNYWNANVTWNGYVQINWGTVSEIENYGFFIHKRTPSSSYFQLPNVFVQGHGTTNEPQNYTVVDSTTTGGTWLYRIKQVDYSGDSSFSDPILITVTAVDWQNNVPTEFALQQNYPNPFNPSTVIQFSLATSGYTTLVIYNVLGQEVCSLINSILSAGQYVLIWDATGNPSGMYIGVLRCGAQQARIKLIINK